MPVVSKFTYTLETIIQAGKLLVAIDHVPIAHQPEDARVAAVPVDVVLRAPQRGLDLPHLRAVRAAAGVHDAARDRCSASPRSSCGPASSSPTSSGNGSGHVQSLILGAVLFNAAVVLGALGVIGDLLSGQRIMPQRIFERVRRIELQLGVAAVALRAGRARRPASRPPPARDAGAEPRPHRGARGRAAVSPAVTRRRRGHGHRQHLRQVRLDQPGRAAADGRLRAHARRAVRAGRARVAARRRLRRGRARRTSGRSGSATGASSASTSRTRAPGRVGEAPGAEPRVPGDEGREPAVRRRRVRPGDARSRCSSTCPTPSTRSPRWRACAQRHLLVSVPREPLWRGLNMARGAYLKDLGNTPGPPQPLVQARRSCSCSRGTARSWRRARRSRGRCCSSAWWLHRSARHAARGRRVRGVARATRAARGSSRSGSRRPGLFTFAYFSVASPRAGRGRLRRDLAAVVGDVRDHLGDLPAGRAAALAHDRRAPGARAARGHPLRVAAADPGRLRARCSWSSRWRCTSRSIDDALRRLERAVLGARRARRSPTRPATSRAAGSPGTSASGSTAGSC